MRTGGPAPARPGPAATTRQAGCSSSSPRWGRRAPPREPDADARDIDHAVLHAVEKVVGADVDRHQRNGAVVGLEERDGLVQLRAEWIGAEGNTPGDHGAA